MAKIVVIGAGMVGASSALWLKRAGHAVTLVDRGSPGMGTSYGNAGVLAACSSVPVTVPGLMGKAPKYLLDRNFPLFLRWGYLPKLLPFLSRYLSYANDSDTRRIAKHLNFIVGDCIAQHQDLAGNTQAGKWLKDTPYCFAYTNRAAFEADHYAWGLRAEHGFTPEILEGHAVQDYQPALSQKLQCLAVTQDHGMVFNPAAYIADLVQTFQEMGGVWQQAEVKNFHLENEKIVSVATDHGNIPCDQAVLATGAFSKPLMAKLGLNIPLESERGYHILYKEPNISPTVPIMIASGKFVATPMQSGLRCAGIIEFGGLEAESSKKPLALMRRKVTEAFPELQARTEEEWLGHRPAPADSLPLIGEIRTSGIYAAFGHHHIGLTAGAKTGRLIADLISNKTQSTDLSAFEPLRFS